MGRWPGYGDVGLQFRQPAIATVGCTASRTCSGGSYLPNSAQVGLTVLDAGFRYDGDSELLRLGLQAHALGIAWEFDPYFGLSVSRVDPLPHQLEAVYDHLLKLPRVRFLLADDAGAGKTIMAGLLIRELQLRGLAERMSATPWAGTAASPAPPASWASRGRGSRS